MHASIRSLRRTALFAASLLVATSIIPGGAAAAPAAALATRSGVAVATQPSLTSPIDLTPGPQAAFSAPVDVGQWGGVLNWGFQGKHMVSLPTGKVLVWSTGDNARVWDPATGLFTPVPAAFGGTIAPASRPLADGRVIVVGESRTRNRPTTARRSALFDPWSMTWTQGASMNYLRWYATSTTLPDGRVLASSGDAPDGTRAPNPEIYNPATDTWTVLTGAPRAQGLYPLMFVLPNGKVLESGPGASTAVLTTSGTGSWAAGPSNSYATNGYSESAVMLKPGVVLRAGAAIRRWVTSRSSAGLCGLTHRLAGGRAAQLPTTSDEPDDPGRRDRHRPRRDTFRRRRIPSGARLRDLESEHRDVDDGRPHGGGPDVPLVRRSPR